MGSSIASTSAGKSALLGVAPVAVFGIDNNGPGVFANLLVIFLFAVWLALVFWTYSDSRRRLEDSVLIGSATLAALIFPFAGALVYAIVRPPETLDDAYERELDVRAAELRVRLLESAVKGGAGSSAHAATVAGEISGEPTGRRPGAVGSGGARRAEPSGREQPSREQSGREPAREPSRNPAREQGRPGSQPQASRPAPGAVPNPPSQPQRPNQGDAAQRPPIAGSDGA
jgi:hypothetical protein